MFPRKFILTCTAAALVSVQAFSVSAVSVRDEALAKDSVQDTIDYINSHISSVDSASGKRGLWCIAGNLQELSMDWMEAAKSYLQALRISGENESGFEPYSVDRLRIAAARCFLNCCDLENAELNLKAFANSSKDENLAALSNLYSVWIILCRSESATDIKASLEKLKSYLDMDSMKSVRSSILFTLWYISGEKKYSDSLEKNHPRSAECAIMKDKASLSAAPFWYFVPRLVDEAYLSYPSDAGFTDEQKMSEKKSPEKTSVSTQGVQSGKNEGEKSSVKPSSDDKKSAQTATPSKKDSSGESSAKSAKKEEKAPEKKKLEREQLGLFRNLANAQALIEQAKSKGFNAYYFPETRASGTTYYIVVVDENEEGTMGRRLRAAGFDCYPIE